MKNRALYQQLAAAGNEAAKQILRIEDAEADDKAKGAFPKKEMDPKGSESDEIEVGEEEDEEDEEK